MLAASSHVPILFETFLQRWERRTCTFFFALSLSSHIGRDNPPSSNRRQQALSVANTSKSTEGKRNYSLGAVLTTISSPVTEKSRSASSVSFDLSFRLAPMAQSGAQTLVPYVPDSPKEPCKDISWTIVRRQSSGCAFPRCRESRYSAVQWSALRAFEPICEFLLSKCCLENAHQLATIHVLHSQMAFVCGDETCCSTAASWKSP